MKGIVEMHNHQLARKGVGDGWYCTFVYMDGYQCDAVWVLYPAVPGDGSRVFMRETVRAWVKAGGEI